MFATERVFSINNPKTGTVGWYFQAREGDFGQYETKSEAEELLKEYIQECIRSGNDGGRSKKGGEDNNQRRLIKKYFGKMAWY
jgi:hypothetical protein